MKHIVNLSGGKDSTAMLLMMLERQMPIDYIVFADTGKDFPQMIDHIKKLDLYIKEKYNKEITVVKLNKDKTITITKTNELEFNNNPTFDYLMFEHEKTKGKNKGKKGYGWATMRCRWCTSYLKQQVINKFCKSLNDKKIIHYIGIAGDEWERLIVNCNFDHKIEKVIDKNGNFIDKFIPILNGNCCVQNLTYKSNYRYPLAEWNITEKQALKYCYEKGFYWGGLYENFDRLSCWCCPLKNLKELKILWKDYPTLWAELKEMDNKSYNKFRADYTVAELEEKFKKEGTR